MLFLRRESLVSQAEKSIKRPVVVISLLTAACLLGDSMLYVVLPTHWQDVGLSSLWEVGILLSVNRLVRLPLNPLVGWLYGKISSRNGIIFAGILATCTTLSYALIQGFALWLLARCVWGLAWTFLRLGAYYTILEVSNETNRGHFMGMYNGLYRLGSLGGMLLGGFIADRCGIGPTALLFGAVTVFAIPFAYVLIPAAKPNRTTETQESLNLSLLLNPDVFWTLLTGMFLAMVYQGAFTATLSLLIHTHYSDTLLLFGISFGAASLSGTLQALRWSWEPWLAPWFGKLSDGKRGRLFFLTTAFILAAVAFSLLPLSLPPALWLLIVLTVLMTATVLTTVIDAIACDVAFQSPPKVFMTLYSFIIDIGAALGPVLGYTLNEFSGPYTVYWAIAAGFVLLALKWLFRPPAMYRT